MFDKAIIDTDKFMDLTMSSKALYFLLGMEADDEGFVSYKKVMRIHGGNEDDMKLLAIKSLIIPFPSGVVVITDWQKNNWLDSRRITKTEYQEEAKMLKLDKDNKYVLSNGLASIEENRIDNTSDSPKTGNLNDKKMKIRAYDEDQFPQHRIEDQDGNLISTPKKEPKVPPQKRLDAENLLREYNAKYKKVIGGTVPHGSKPQYLRQVYPVLEQYTLKQLIDMLDNYFDDDFYRDSNWAIWTFLSWKVLNRLNK